MTSLADKERLPREIVAMRVAKELPDGSYVNLGIGIPTLVSSFVPEGRTVFYHSESGILNCGPVVDPGDEEQEDIDLINAGGQYLQSIGGMSFFDSAEAFLDALHRSGVGEAEVMGGAEGLAGDDGDARFGEQPLGQLDGAGDAIALHPLAHIGASRSCATGTRGSWRRSSVRWSALLTT